MWWLKETSMTYFVPTIRSKNNWIGSPGPSTLSISLSTRNCATPLTPPPSRHNTLTPALAGLTATIQGGSAMTSPLCNGHRLISIHVRDVLVPYSSMQGRQRTWPHGSAHSGSSRRHDRQAEWLTKAVAPPAPRTR